MKITELPAVNPDGRYTITQAAELFCIHRTTLWRWLRQGRLYPYTPAMGRRLRFRGKDLIEMWNRGIF